jgi:hypothetical protein
VLLFVAWSCHGITNFLFFFLTVVIWIKRAYFYCWEFSWYNNCRGLENASFRCLALSWDYKVLIFLSYSCYLDKTSIFLLLGVFMV